MYPEFLGVSLCYFYDKKIKIKGNIPTNIGNLSKLRKLELQDNQLTGNIPNSMGDLTKLSSLNLAKNQLIGKCPDSVKNINIKELNLEDNMLESEESQKQLVFVDEFIKSL